MPYEISRGSREIPPPTNASIVICLLKFAHKMGAAENNDFTVIHIPGGHSTFPTFFSRGHMKILDVLLVVAVMGSHGVNINVGY